MTCATTATGPPPVRHRAATSTAETGRRLRKHIRRGDPAARQATGPACSVPRRRAEDTLAASMIAEFKYVMLYHSVYRAACAERAPTRAAHGQPRVRRTRR